MPPEPRPAHPELPAEPRRLSPGDPRAIGPFTVVGRLGEGGMGVVYAALDGDRRCVAVKVIKPRYADSPRYRELFAREAALAARVDAECAPRFLGADPDAPQPWLATEFVPGRTLKRYVAERGPLTGDTATAFAAGAAEALAAVHAAGVVHLDVKPGNVVLAPDGPKVLDFGIARAIDDGNGGNSYGTPGWVAPERLDGAAGTFAADMFAWGGLVAYAATGRSPFGEGEAAELTGRVRAGDFDIGGVPEELRDLVERALSTDPERRPTAQQALDRLLRIRADADARARRERLRELLRRAWTGFDAAGHRAAAWAALGGALATATSSGAATGDSASRAAAAAGRSTGRSKVLAAAAGVTAVAVIAGAWTAGRVATGRPILPTAASGPETASPAPTAAARGQTVEYRGLELTFPADWTVTAVEDVVFDDVQDPDAGQIVDDFLIAHEPGQAGCAERDWAREWWWQDRDCRHVKILGPGAIRFTGPIDAAAYSGRSITEDDNRGVFHPSNQGGLPCPSANGVNPYGEDGQDYVPAEDLQPADLDDPPPSLVASERTAVHGRDALRREYRIFCVDITSDLEPPEYAGAFFLQRSWFLPDAQILVVDQYGIDGLDEVMAP